MLADRRVHQRLGEARLVALIVAEAAVAPHVDDDVAVERLAVFDRELAGEGHRFGIVAVDVQDRRLDALGDVGRVRRRARELRAGGEADLVVDDEVEAAAGVVAAGCPRSRGIRQTMPWPAKAASPWSSTGRTARRRSRSPRAICCARTLPSTTGSTASRWLGLGTRRQMDLDAVELAVGRGAEMIFDVARAADILGIGGAAGEFVRRSRGRACPSRWRAR